VVLVDEALEIADEKPDGFAVAAERQEGETNPFLPVDS
jgi:hypothetical protein